MKKTTFLIIITPLILFSSLLFIKDLQAGFIFLILFVIFTYLILKSLVIKNNLLTMILSLSGIAHVIGAPLFILNKKDYSYSGWNAVKDFDFTPSFFLKVYAYSISSIIFLVLFTTLIQKYFITKESISREKSLKKDNNRYSLPWSILFFLLLVLSIFTAIFMYVNNIAILGIESDRLPFKLVGILFYFRGYVLPVILFLVYKKTSRSFFVSLSFILVALIVGALSASRGVTLIYLFPVLLEILNKKFALKHFILILFLIILGYFTTSLTRDAMYSSTGLSIVELSTLILNTSSSFKSDEGLLYSLLSIISTMSNRLYGAQDSVLAYQYVLVNPWESFINFIFSGTLVNDLAGELYGLEFLPGMGYGVGLGLVALFVMIGKSNIFLMLISILFFSILISYVNYLLKKAFFNYEINKYTQVYYLFLFLIGFNFVQATLVYIYVSIIITYLIIYIKQYQKKIPF